MNAVDTNVFVSLVDVDEPAKRARANELMDQLAAQEDSTVLLWQVAVEFLACLRRWEDQRKVTRSQRLKYWHQVAAMFDILPPTVKVIDMALELSSRYSLSHWDSLLVAGCLEANVKTLYSEDLAHRMTYESVTVINPFA